MRLEDAPLIIPLPGCGLRGGRSAPFLKDNAVPSPPCPLLTQSPKPALPDITTLLPEGAEAFEAQRGYPSKVTQRGGGNSCGGMLMALTPLRPRPHSVTHAPDSARRKIPQLHQLMVARIPGVGHLPSSDAREPSGARPRQWSGSPSTPAPAQRPTGWGLKHRLLRTEDQPERDTREQGGTGRWLRKEMQSHLVGHNPEPSREARGRGGGDRGGCRGLHAEHEEGSQRCTLAPYRHAPAPAHWST